MKKKALIITNRSFNLIRSRLPLMLRLKQDGWEVTAIAHQQKGYEGVVESYGIEFLHCPLRDNIFNLKVSFKIIMLFYRLIKAKKYDVIHCFTPKPIIFFGLLSRLMKISSCKICTITGFGFQGQSTLLQRLVLWFYRMFLLKYDGVIFENQTAKEIAIKQKITVAEKIFVQISSGVDLKKFQLRKKKQIPIKIIFASRLVWSKGIRELFEAMEKIKIEFKENILIIIAGEIEQDHKEAVPLEFLQSYSKKGLIDYVGQLKPSEVPDLLVNGHIMVLPSYFEGASKSLMEGAAAGLALVATDIPGCREMIIQNRNGYLVPPRNSDKIHENLRKLIRNPDKIVEFGEYSRKLAEKNFDQEKLSEATTHFYYKKMVDL